MLESLRVIPWPDDLMPAGQIIDGRLASQVHDYDDLMALARKRAAEIEAQAEKDAQLEVEMARQATAESVQDDFDLLIDFSRQQQDSLLKKSSESCVEVAQMAVESVFSSMSDEDRIQFLVETLLKQVHERNVLTFTAHPSQIEKVEAVIAQRLSSLIPSGGFVVKPDSRLEQDRLRLTSAGDSFIEVSIANVLAIVNTEIQELKGYFEETLHAQDGASTSGQEASIANY